MASEKDEKIKRFLGTKLIDIPEDDVPPHIRSIEDLRKDTRQRWKEIHQVLKKINARLTVLEYKSKKVKKYGKKRYNPRR